MTAISLLRNPHTIRGLDELVVGPGALVLASLIDMYLATRVFVTVDPLTGTLSLFILGATVGVPVQFALARFGLEPHEGEPKRSSRLSRSARIGAALAGGLATFATLAWLYALRVSNAAIVLPLAHLTPVVFAVVESARGQLRVRRTLAPVGVLLLGLWIVGAPKANDVETLTPLVVIVLLVRNLSAAGSEAAERAGAGGNVARFVAVRFAWLAAVGIPLVVVFAIATDRGVACLEVIREVFPVALPAHLATMLLVFVAGTRRTQAKATRPLTICVTAYSTPLVVAPLLAAFVNRWMAETFPTVTGSLHLTLGAILIVGSAVWLGCNCSAREHRFHGLDR